VKVYDTDEQAIATGARQKMLARVIQTLMMLAFSGLGFWLFYTLILAPDKTAERIPMREVATLKPNENMIEYPGVDASGHSSLFHQQRQFALELSSILAISPKDPMSLGNAGGYRCDFLA
jgi:hypothetical protein